MSSSYALSTEQEPSNDTSLVGYLINRIVGIVLNSLISVLPLNKCINRVLGGAGTGDILFNCGLDIIALIPIFTPFVIAFRVAIPTIQRVLNLVFNLVGNILSFIFGGSNNSNPPPS